MVLVPPFPTRKMLFTRTVKGNFPPSCLCFHLGWRNFSLYSPLRVPNIRLDCKVLSRNFSLRHGNSPWITKSLIILLAKPAYSPWVAVTPDAGCPPCSGGTTGAFQAGQLLSIALLPPLFQEDLVFLGTLAVFSKLQNQVALSNYA